MMGITLQQVFRQHFDAVAAKRRLSSDMYRAAWAVRHCRTRELGGHVNSCPVGHVCQVAYNSCMHRSCPQCAWLPREQWLAGWKRRLLPTPHHHIVFTVPHSLNELWRYNKVQFSKLLFDAAFETLHELLADPKYLGAVPGILAALHTWNQKLDVHVHLHVLVTAGGLGPRKQWVKSQRKCLLPRKVLMIKFRGKFRAFLRERVAKRLLRLPPQLSSAGFQGLLQSVGSLPWNVKIHEAYLRGESVAIYLARYIKGGPMGRARLLEIRDGKVEFRYRLSALEGGDGKRQGIAQLPVESFIRRWLEHVPPRRMQTVRGSGLYCGNQHSQLTTARESLGLRPLEPLPQQRMTWQERCVASGYTAASRCKQCGATLVSHSSFPAGRGPPRSAFRRRFPGQVA